MVCFLGFFEKKSWSAKICQEVAKSAKKCQEVPEVPKSVKKSQKVPRRASDQAKNWNKILNLS